MHHVVHIKTYTLFDGWLPPLGHGGLLRRDTCDQRAIEGALVKGIDEPTQTYFSTVYIETLRHLGTV